MNRERMKARFRGPSSRRPARRQRPRLSDSDTARPRLNSGGRERIGPRFRGPAPTAVSGHLVVGASGRSGHPAIEPSGPSRGCTGHTRHLDGRASDRIHPFGSSVVPSAASDRPARLVCHVPTRVRHTHTPTRQTATPRQTTVHLVNHTPRRVCTPATLITFALTRKPQIEKAPVKSLPLNKIHARCREQLERQWVYVRHEPGAPHARTRCQPYTNRVAAMHKPGGGRAQTEWRPCTNRVAAVHEPVGGRARTGWQPYTNRVAAVHEPGGGRRGTGCRPKRNRVADFSRWAGGGAPASASKWAPRGLNEVGRVCARPQLIRTSTPRSARCAPRGGQART
jgi:hypothetical protein